jgi:hypothetical protein
MTINIAHMWRGRMTEYFISEMEGSVSIGMNKPKNAVEGFFEGFIDIHTDECDVDSPFENIETARMFAEIIVKCLRIVSD